MHDFSCKFKAEWKRLAFSKHASLFRAVVSDDEKQLYKASSRGLPQFFSFLLLWAGNPHEGEGYVRLTSKLR
jgi:hypothetical protein